MDDPIQITLWVIEALEKAGASYLIGGSLASSIHGIPRATMDVDLVSDLKIQQVPAFVKELENKFYADADSIRQSIQMQQSFNIIHLASMLKIDIFPLNSRGYEQKEFQRKQKETIAANPRHEAYVATPEDTILTKLVWFRKGGEVSDRQWGDILGVFKVQGGRLDRDYLKQWAKELGVLDLLERARKAQK